MPVEGGLVGGKGSRVHREPLAYRDTAQFRQPAQRRGPDWESAGHGTRVSGAQ